MSANRSGMDNAAINLTNEDLQKQIALLEQKVAELTAKLDWYERQYRLAMQRRYGSSSERTAPEERQLFNEAEAEAKPSLPEPTIETITYHRKKKAGHRQDMLKDLPVEVVEHRLSEEERICERCGSVKHEMSKQVKRVLEIIPAQVKVREDVYFVYSCRTCEHSDTTTPITTAEMPASVIPGSLASPSAIAHVMTQKYVMGMPLYRQEQQLHQLGVQLSRQTLANWMLAASDRWLTPIYDRMRDHLLKQEVLHADETTLQVLREEGRRASTQSYLWLYRTGRDGPPIILFDYQTTRSAKHPRRFLEGFKGYLHVDGYVGYDGLPGIILVGCWAHARRRFDEALKALPPSNSGEPATVQKGLEFCNRLFAIERDLKDVSVEERYRGRLERSKPVLDAFLAWLDEESFKTLPKSALGQAIAYCHTQWSKLTTFLQDGRLELDNNRSERSIKPFVIGRKNWLFSNTPRGAQASATIYSIVETAIENGVIPFDYLRHIFEVLPNMHVTDLADLDRLLPWSSDLPASLKMQR